MPSPTSPLNAIPPVVAALAILMGGMEIVLALADRGILGGRAGIGWRIAAIEDYGVFDAILEAMWARGVAPPEHLVRLVAYPFVHLGFVHAAFAIAMLLALGKMVGEVFAPWATAAVFFVPAVSGALAWSALVDDPRPLVGAYPGVYGLIGAFTFPPLVASRGARRAAGPGVQVDRGADGDPGRVRGAVRDRARLGGRSRGVRDRVRDELRRQPRGVERGQGSASGEVKAGGMHAPGPPLTGAGPTSSSVMRKAPSARPTAA